MNKKISRAERERQERLAEKPKENIKPKDKQSEFDKVLQESKLMYKNPASTQRAAKTLADDAARDAHRKEERKQDGDRVREKHEEKEGDQSEKSKKSESKTLQERVVAKGQLKDGKGGGEGQGKGSFGFGKGRKGVDFTQQKSSNKMTGSVLQTNFASKLQASLAKSMHDPAITQAVLNQLVQYVKIGLNKQGDKEIQIELHEKIFRGLKMRVVSKDGKVLVHFMAADAKTRKIFEKNKDAIKDALSKKGIEVEDVRVT